MNIIRIILILLMINKSAFAAVNPLQIGDYYQGGVIFYLDETQKKGLLVAINDADYTQSPACMNEYHEPGCTWWNWQEVGERVTGATDMHYFKGEENTRKILNINSGPTVYPAAYVAHRYATPEDPPGAYWYLPSEGELNELMLAVSHVPLINASIKSHGGQVLPLLGSQKNRWYWSSTELPDDNTEYTWAWVVLFNEGSVGSDFKYSPQSRNLVRPIRTFDY